MTDEIRRSRNAAWMMLATRAIYFVVLLLFVIVAYRSFPIPAFVMIVTIVLTVVAIVALGLGTAARRQRRWIEQVKAAQPGAAIVSAEWNATILPPFVADPTLTAGTDARGFDVMVTADGDGLQLWRGGSRVVVPLGRIPWSSLEGFSQGQEKAAVGPKRVNTIRIVFREPSQTLISPVQLVVRKEPVPAVIARLLAMRHDDQTHV